MGIFAEARRQIRFMRKLLRLLGWRDATRFRSAMFGARYGWHAGKMLTLRHPSLLHPVFARINSTDADVFGQVIRDAEYDPVAVGDPHVIVDCGANAGYTSAYLLSRFPNAHVIAIEPFADNAQLCRRNLAPYGDRATVVEAAVWSSKGRLVLEADSGNEWGVRVRPAERGELSGVKAIDIPSLGLDHIDILKVDIEGSEAELFAAGVEDWLPHVGSIAIELHGADCERAFRAAMGPYRFHEIHSGELTICLDMAERERVPA